jgi:glycosyltransferase involved in cell wall biosynthesis
MRIVLLAHPGFMHSQSMPRFARMLQQAYLARGHDVVLWVPQPHLHRLLPQGPLAKWAGYVDQYLLFPLWLRAAVGREPQSTLFVMTDQAQGPWVPYTRQRPLVVHVHDLLALRSALGDVPENPTGFTGRIYQRYIRKGFERARHFICISRRTQQDLQRFSAVRPHTIEVIYNGLNYPYQPTPAAQAVQILKSAGHSVPEHGLLLHVSGNQWYKNVTGVLRLYAHHVRVHAKPLPLWLIGVPLTPAVQAALSEVPSQGKVHFVYDLSNAELQAVYSLSRAFLFPSLAEGFGWPIVEAQACGCPVITTNDTPMNEIGGPEARYLPPLRPQDDAQAWARDGANVLGAMLDVSDEECQRRSTACVQWARHFDADTAIDHYLQIYQAVLAWEQPHQPAAAMEGGL